MGGKGSGGRRPGSGRKPKTEHERQIDGNAGHRGRILPHPSAPVDTTVPPVEEFDAPDDLSLDERQVWVELAPFAFANRTLTRATALSFRLLCRNVVLERAFAKGIEKGGPNHRGLIQRVDAELLRFNLSPCGKPMVEPQAHASAPVNPLDRFLKRDRGA